MSNSFKWCGYNWKPEMSGGRIININKPWMWYSTDIIRVYEGGVLELWLRKNPKKVKYWDGNTYEPDFEVATMRSVEDFSYGSFSASIMMPAGTSLWSSFWTSGSENWPPEIDIVEAWSGDDKYFKWFTSQAPFISPSWKTTTNVHFNNDKLEHNSVGSKNISWFKQNNDPTENWITYKCDWKPSSITFYVNNKEIRKITGDVCKNLVKNLKNPEKGYRMNVIFNIWCEDPKKYEVNMKTPMRIKDFKYEPYTIYYKPN